MGRVLGMTRFAAMRLDKNFELTYLEEAFTSEHWIVRIFRVRPTLVLTLTINHFSHASLTGQEAY